ncbi:uncharacterized protein ACLA_099710, partial [Aspergillus clavatus NRRL 1]
MDYLCKRIKIVINYTRIDIRIDISNSSNRSLNNHNTKMVINNNTNNNNKVSRTS